MSDDVNQLTRRIIGAAITVHRFLGPGLLESTYQVCLAAELRENGMRVDRHVPVPVIYRDIKLECGYRIDLLVEHSVVVELKVARALDPVFSAQVLTYLRLAELQVGLLFNFGAEALANGGIRRIVRGPGIRRPSETDGGRGGL